MQVGATFKNFMRNTWARITTRLILRRLKSNPDSPLDFARFFRKPEDWLLVMPLEANAFDSAAMHCRALLEQLEGVSMHLLVPFEFRHWVKTSPKLKVVPFHKKDLFLGYFPRRALLERLRRIDPAVALDLNPWPTPLSLCACGQSGARVRGSLSRTEGDAVFNFLVKARNGEIGERYRALFAYLS